jgi:hypothetical protein
MLAQVLAALHAPAGDPYPDAALGEEAAAARVVVALIGMHPIRSLAPVAERLLDGGQRGDEPLELDAVVLTGSGER